MSTHLGTTNFLELPTVGGVPLVLNAGATPSIQAGTVLPAAGTVGRLFFDTAAHIVYRDTGSSWVRESSPVIQFATAAITPSSGTTLLPYDNTLPSSAEGIAGWSASFTPLLATSTIVITTSSFITTSSANDMYMSGVHYNGTTAFGAQMLGFATNAGNGNNFCMVSAQAAGSTAARTYSFRYGSAGSGTVYLAQGSSGQAFGAANTGRWTIVELAP